MPTRTFDFVPEFNMDTALYDKHERFYNTYRRDNIVSPGTKRPKTAANGAVRCSTSGHYDQNPALHFADGSLAILHSAQHHDNRGRYTFGGYDFSIIASSNDYYGSLAVKHMSLPPRPEICDGCAPVIEPKVNLAAFNTLRSGSIESQDLLIDHRHNRVYALGAARDANGTDVTVDGADMSSINEGAPEFLRYIPWRLYALGPDRGFVAMRSIRMSTPRTPKTLPQAYYDTVAACCAWYAHQSETMDAMYQNYMRNRKIERGTNYLNDLVDPDYAANQGFAGLHPYERARVATVNTKKTLPRLMSKYYRLIFDSNAFFATIEGEKV